MKAIKYTALSAAQNTSPHKSNEITIAAPKQENTMIANVEIYCIVAPAKNVFWILGGNSSWAELATWLIETAK